MFRKTKPRVGKKVGKWGASVPSRITSKSNKQTTSLLAKTEGLYPSRVLTAPPIRGPIAPRRELKFVDVANANYALDTTGSVTPLNLIAQGTDNNQRVGNQAIMASVQLLGMALSTGATTTPMKGRILLIWDNASNGAVPTIAQVLTVSSSESFHNINQQDRFTILWDHSLVLGNAALGDQTVKDVNVEVALSSVTQYGGPAGTQANVANGGLYLITIGSNVAGATAATARLSTRVRFLDPE